MYVTHWAIGRNFVAQIVYTSCGVCKQLALTVSLSPRHLQPLRVPRLRFSFRLRAACGMSAFERKYALCHLCPGKWIRKDTIPQGFTVEEACGAHTEPQLERHFKNEVIWNAQQLARLHKAQKKMEREQKRKLKLAKARGALRKKPAAHCSINKVNKVMKKPAAAAASKKIKRRSAAEWSWGVITVSLSPRVVECEFCAGASFRQRLAPCCAATFERDAQRVCASAGRWIPSVDHERAS